MKIEDFSVLERVLKVISRYSMLTPGDRVIVAVSGGADSVGLLHVLREIAPQFGASVAGVAHVNHQLRGEESENDAHFVSTLAVQLGLRIHCENAWASVGKNLEEFARLKRREVFEKLILDGEATRVALGHTRDDQAETVLFRLLRGSGLAGLAGIHPISANGFIRPLIEITRDEMREYLRDRSVEWREDSSNLDPRFARNRIRHQLLPLLTREWNPNIAESLAQLSDLAFEEERYWDRNLPEASTELSARALQEMPRAVARRVVRRAIRFAKGNLRRIEFAHVEQVLDLKSGWVRLPGVEVARSFDQIRFSVSSSSIAEPLEVTIPGTYPSPDGSSRIRFETTESAASFQSPMILRGWRPGDHYRRIGSSRDQKLKEMFQRARIPAWQRPGWPILESDGKILWTREFGLAHDFAERGRQGTLRVLEER